MLNISLFANKCNTKITKINSMAPRKLITLKIIFHIIFPIFVVRYYATYGKYLLTGSKIGVSLSQTHIKYISQTH